LHSPSPSTLTASRPASPTALWHDIRRALREAFWRRARGDAEAADKILHGELPPRIVAWSQADPRDKAAKKQLIERTMEEEQRRVEEAHALVELVSSKVTDEVVRRVETRLVALLEQQARILTESRSPAAHAELREYFLNLATKPAADAPAPAQRPGRSTASPAPEPHKIPIGDIAQMIDYVHAQEETGNLR
jgi:hypothetical protein